MGTARALVVGSGSWPPCRAIVSKPCVALVSVSVMSALLLSDVVHGGLGDGRRAENGARALPHLAPHRGDQGFGLVAAAHSPLTAVGAGGAGAPAGRPGAPAVDEVDHVREGHAGRITGDDVAAALAAL